MKKLFALLLALSVILPAFSPSLAAEKKLPREEEIQSHYKNSYFEVTINAPEGYSGRYSGRVSLHTDQTYNYAHADFSFDGASHTVQIPLPMNPDDYLGLSLRLDEGPGIIPDSTHFRTQWGWTDTYDEKNQFYFPYGSTTITMPGVRHITGKFVSAQGDPVMLTVLNPGVYFYCDGNMIKNTCSAESDGSFILSVPDYITGTCSLSCFPYGTNILYDQYYYHASAEEAVTQPVSGDPDLCFQLEKDTTPELTILVNTGYVLTGTIAPAEGGYLTNEYDEHFGSVSVTVDSSDYSFRNTAQVFLDKGSSLWTYSVAVPKQADSYTMSVWPTLSHNTCTNLCFDRFTVGTVEVSGDGELPPVTLPVGRDTVTVTITNPCPGYPVSYGYLTMAADDGSYYSRDFSIDASRDSTTVTLSTSSNCTAETYTLAYQIYDYGSTDCTLIFFEPFWLTADGSLTGTSGEAERFSFDKTEQAFTLAEYPPYLTGRIYLPCPPDDEEFSISIFENLGGEFSVPVTPSTLRQDEEGRYYVTYKRYWENGNDELIDQSFGLYYYLTDYEGSAFYDKGESGCLAYLRSIGGFWFEPERDRFNEEMFTISSADALQLDFALAAWDDDTENALLQSEHGVSSFDETTYILRYPKDVEIKVFFDRRTDVDLIINGYRWTCEEIRDGHYAGSIWLDNCDGTLTVTVPAGEYDENKFGFSVLTCGACNIPNSTIDPGVAAVYTPAGGSDESVVMGALAAGEPIWVSIIGDRNFSGILCAALYDENDRMIDVTVVEKDSRDNGSYDSCLTHTLNFDRVEGAVSLRVFLSREDRWAPQMEDHLVTTKD